MVVYKVVCLLEDGSYITFNEEYKSLDSAISFIKKRSKGKYGNNNIPVVNSSEEAMMYLGYSIVKVEK